MINMFIPALMIGSIGLLTLGGLIIVGLDALRERREKKEDLKLQEIMFLVERLINQKLNEKARRSKKK